MWIRGSLKDISSPKHGGRSRSASLHLPHPTLLEPPSRLQSQRLHSRVRFLKMPGTKKERIKGRHVNGGQTRRCVPGTFSPETNPELCTSALKPPESIPSVRDRSCACKQDSPLCSLSWSRPRRSRAPAVSREEGGGRGAGSGEQGRGWASLQGKRATVAIQRGCTPAREGTSVETRGPPPGLERR